MALIRFQDLDPVRHLLALQQELDRFQRNPGVSLGPSGHGAFPPVNLFRGPRGNGCDCRAARRRNRGAQGDGRRQNAHYKRRASQ